MLFFLFPVPTHSQCLMERLWSVVIREPAGVVIESDTFSLGGGGGAGVGGQWGDLRRGWGRSISAKVLRRGDYSLKRCNEEREGRGGRQKHQRPTRSEMTGASNPTDSIPIRRQWITARLPAAEFVPGQSLSAAPGPGINAAASILNPPPHPHAPPTPPHTPLLWPY